MPTYTPLAWEDEVPGETPVKYVITGDVEGEISASATIELATAPTAGTPVNATNMNHIEQGIEDAQDSINAIVYRRQGGDPDSWDVPGTNNYTPASVLIQVGIGISTVAANGTVVFPVEYAHPPIVYLYSYDAVGGPVTSTTVIDLTAAGFTFNAQHDGVRILAQVNWLAIASA